MQVKTTFQYSDFKIFIKLRDVSGYGDGLSQTKEI